MRLPPPDVIVRDVMGMRTVREQAERLGDEVALEGTALVYERAFDEGTLAANVRVVPSAGATATVAMTSGWADKPRLAEWVEGGTGIYGPERRRITPKRGKYLVFKVAKGAPRASMSGRRTESGLVFARSVRGREASWIMRDAAMRVAARHGLRFRNLRDWQG